MNKQKELRELAKVFFRLGCIGFGGPAVHIAMMEEEVVHKRKWMSQEHFLDLVGATNLIPGPNSTEMTMHCGQERAGWRGLIVAGLCFILPAVIITAAFAAAYQKYGQLPELKPWIYGIQPAIIALLVSLMIRLGKNALKSTQLGIIGAIAAALALGGANEILVLFGAGFAGILLYLLKRPNKILNSLLPLILVRTHETISEMFDWKLFWIFLKIGAILYGSGYVLFAFLDAELVNSSLLSRAALTDAIAVGQFTPGPVFSAATFIGWQISGPGGALAATAGIFLPSFLFVALLNPLIAKLRQSQIMSVFLDTVNIASVALILVVCIDMAQLSISNWRSSLIALCSFAVSFLFPKLNSALIVFGGALLGYLLWLC